jgi:hypothetical protein
MEGPARLASWFSSEAERTSRSRPGSPRFEPDDGAPGANPRRMTGVPETTSIEYGAYTAADAEPMAELLGDVFSRRDPPAVAVGLTASEFEAFVRLLCPRVDAQGLTIVARLPDTREFGGRHADGGLRIGPPGRNGSA